MRSAETQRFVDSRVGFDQLITPIPPDGIASARSRWFVCSACGSRDGALIPTRAGLVPARLRAPPEQPSR